MFRAIAVLFFLVASIAAAHAGPNFLVNGDFETGSLDPWLAARSPNSDTVETPWEISRFAHSGSFAATVRGNIELRQDLGFGVSTDSITQLDLFVWNDGGCACNAYVLFFDDGSQEQFGIFNQQDQWTHVDLLFAVPANQIVTGFSIFGNDGGLTIVDDVILDPPVDVERFASNVPEPAGIALFTLPMITLMRHRRQGCASA